MYTRLESTQQHLSNMLAVDAHILAVLQRQRATEAASERPRVASLLARMENMLQR